MALTGQLLADFESFQKAASEAVVKLGSLDAGAHRVESALNQMVESFSGRKVVQEAILMAEAVERIGGASKLTASELERVKAKSGEAEAKLKALGLDVPESISKITSETKGATVSLDKMADVATTLAGALGIAFSVEAAVNFGKAILDNADHLVKLSDTTGIAIEDLQRLSYVAGQSGNDVDELTAAVSKLQTRLNDPKAQLALRDLRIDLTALSAESPYRQFELIADAIAKIPNPAEQAERAVAIFGNTGTSILPTLKSAFSELANEATVSSRAQIQALDAAGDALERTRARATNMATQVAGSYALLIEKYGALAVANALATGRLLDLASALEQVQKEARAAAAETPKVAPPPDPLVAYRKHLDELRASSQALSGVQHQLIRDASDLGESNSQIAARLNLDIQVVTKYTEAWKALQNEWKSATEAFTKKVAQAEAKSLLETAELWRALNVERVQQTGTATDAQLANIDRWFSDEAAKLNKSTKNWEAHYDALKALSDAHRESVLLDWDTIREKSLATLREQAEIAQRTYDYMATHAHLFSREALEEQRDKTREAWEAARIGAQTYVRDVDEVKQKVRESWTEVQILASETRHAEEEARRLAEQYTIVYENARKAQEAALGDDIKALMAQGYSMEEAFRIRTEQVYGSPRGGGPGQRQNTPAPEVNPQSGWNYPGMAPVTVNMNVSGVMDPATTRQLAGAVKDEIMKTAKFGRQFS